MKKFVIQTFILVAITFIALYLATSKTPTIPGLVQHSAEPENNQLTIGGTTINIELADTADERKRGLSGRQSLAADTGLLFVYDKPGLYAYWMKGVNFPLDFIWIKNGRVVDLLKNIPVAEPNTSDESLPRYLPNQEIDTVLETNAGFIDS